MAERRIITGKDFVNQILNGKMTFRNVRIVNPDLRESPNYSSIQEVTTAMYQGANYGEGIDFTGSDLTGLTAPGIFLRGAVFDDTLLNNVNFDNAQISYSTFRRARIDDFSVKNGIFSCLDFERARIRGLDISGSEFFENSLKQGVFFNVDGIKTCKYVPTIGIRDVFVDPGTYEDLKVVFPVYAPLVAQDVLEDLVIDDEMTIPAGSLLINGEYYLTAWRRKIMQD